MPKSVKEQYSQTLNRRGVHFSLHPYRYEEKGGTTTAAQELQADHHMIIKTLVLEDNTDHPLLMLMHGDKKVSTKALARIIGVKSIRPCDPEDAHLK